MSVAWGLLSTAPINRSILAAARESEQADVIAVASRRSELEILGEEGGLFVTNPFVIRSPGIELRRSGEVEHVVVDHVDSYLLELENVSRAIRDGRPLLLGGEDAVGQARTIKALYQAAA